MSPRYELDYKEIPDFLSEKQISEHYKLYHNYYNQTVELPSKINGTGVANPTGIRGQQKTLQYALAGRDLHEIYFEGLTYFVTNPESAPKKFKDLVDKSFGTFQMWKDDFVACAMAARGWAIVELDPRNDILYNVVSDFHDEGGTIGFKPILALDMYEHAYFYDYQTNKKAYIEKWWSHINWNAVLERLS